MDRTTQPSATAAGCSIPWRKPWAGSIGGGAGGQSEPAKKGKGAKNTSASKSAKSKSDSGGSAKNHLAAQPKNLAAKK
jgi:hypothetical protein